MLDSVRVRLTLWYSGVLALVLVSLAVVTYFLYAHSTSQRADTELTQLTDAFVTTFNAELADSTGADAVRSAAREALAEHRFRDTYFLVLDSSQHVTESSLDLPVSATPYDAPAASFFSSEPLLSLLADPPGELHTIRSAHHAFRALVRPLPIAGYTLVALQSLHQQKETMADIRRTFLWAIPFALLFAALSGYFLAGKSLAPISAMTAEARSIGAAHLDRRLPVANDRDELGQLARTFNDLLERLETSFEQQRRFMADASHELRTPVAILRGETEVTLSRPDRSIADYRETLSTLLLESQRLSHIIDDLFILARADAGQYPLVLRDAYLDELATESLTRARSLALTKNIALQCDIQPDLPIRADESLLGRMLLNLLDNAIKYSPSGSAVTLSCHRSGSSYELSVFDNGPGIPSEFHSQIFERFFRTDKARSRAESDSSGAGLGLAIARWIAEAHHGQLVLARSDNSGSTFTATLPAPPGA